MILMIEVIVMKKAVNNYINCKVINIKSEILFRQAEDDFYYFNNLNKAITKLKKALDYTPNHLKSLMLYADICFIKGNFKKALSLYTTANILQKNNCRITASIANCHNSLKQYEEALKYCNNALFFINGTDYALYAQVIELKINSLVSLKRYDESYQIFTESQEFLRQNLVNEVYKSLNEKIKLHQKLHYSGLKIV